MAIRGRGLNENQQLEMNDMVVSSNGVFSAYMQDDGNFVVRKGREGIMGWGSVQANLNSSRQGPRYALRLQDDGNLVLYTINGDIYNPLWGTAQIGGYNLKKDEYNCGIQDDGNFCVYKTGSTRALWCTRSEDPVRSIEAIHEIIYDINNVIIIETNDVELERQEYKNASTVAQSYTISGQTQVQVTSSWSDSLGENVSVSVNATVGFPGIGSGGVTASAGITHTYSRTETVSSSRTESYSFPIQVPSKSNMSVKVVMSRSKVLIPFSMLASLRLSSNALVTAQTRGGYKGADSFDVRADVTQSGAV